MLRLVIAIFVFFSLRMSDAVSCSSSQKKAQKKGVDIESNGCSKPAGLQISGEEDFTFCCDRHDACYATCSLSQNYCDKDFEKCMKNMCKEHFKQNDQCQGAAQMYAMGPMMFGKEPYEDLQQRHCTCVSKDQVINSYEEVIDSYLQKYVAESKRNSTKSYMEKSKYTETKPQMLFYQILKKFPTIIQHIEGREKMGKVIGYDEL